MLLGKRAFLRHYTRRLDKVLLWFCESLLIKANSAVARSGGCRTQHCPQAVVHRAYNRQIMPWHLPSHCGLSQHQDICWRHLLGSFLYSIRLGCTKDGKDSAIDSHLRVHILGTKMYVLDSPVGTFSPFSVFVMGRVGRARKMPDDGDVCPSTKSLCAAEFTAWRNCFQVFTSLL